MDAGASSRLIRAKREGGSRTQRRAAHSFTPFRGRREICELKVSSSGTGVGKLSGQFFSTLASTRTVSIHAKFSPMQIRDPAPKGKNARRGRLAAFSGRNRSGSYRIGSG